MLNRIAAASERFQGSLPRLRLDKSAWHRLLHGIGKTIEIMPLWKLQTVGPDKLCFLYPNVGKGDRIRLHGEAVYCLRRFRDLIGDLAEMRVAGWACAQAERGGAARRGPGRPRRDPA